MPQRRLLLLDAHHLRAFGWQGGLLREEGRFSSGDEGAATFSAYLGEHRASNFYLLANLAEESFHVETLPYTRGSDRKSLLSRKLGQHFHGTPLATTISLGRGKSGRRDENFLFTALTRPQLLAPWLAALQAAEAQVAGVFSLPQLGTRLLGKIRPLHPQCLLITLTRGGVRQVFFENGHPRFSRLTPLGASDAEQAAAACATETARIHQYLLSQRLIAHGIPLPVNVLAHPAHLDAFLQLCRKTPDLHPRIVDLHALGRSCGLRSLPPDSDSELLFLHLLARRPPHDQLAPAAERRFFLLWRLRSILTRTGALALLGSLLFAAMQLYVALDLRSRTEENRAQAEIEGETYTAIQKTFPPMPASTDILRAVIRRYDEIEQGSAAPEPLYLSISRGLQDAPLVEVERLDWLHGASPDEGAGMQDRSKPDAVLAGQPGQSTHAIALVHGTLPPAMADDQRGQFDAINGLAAKLRMDPSLKVTILRQSFDIESGKTLKSGGDSAAGPAQPRFLLQISRKP